MNQYSIGQTLRELKAFAYILYIPLILLMPIGWIGILFAYTLGWREITSNDFTLALNTTVAVLGFIYFIQKQKLEEEKLFFDQFANFNKRFHDLSQSLNQLSEIDCEHQDTIGIVGKYFDLCLEEYQLYQYGRIPEKTWRYWGSGMLYYIRKYPCIEQHWRLMEREALDDGLTIAWLQQHCADIGNAQES
ncbi:hypothetical protein [Thiothrix unzii]|uniref:Uncharacterized protein n=1 Tax=Thiothrix unzii TaxID=111769 RepID=A0A975IGG8_9GAMM|nr:hypothetical protein [Thiothrix unzii]QTR53016.1 hypothetical protein J9260_15100 [Thiothrix unzii]